MTRVRRAPDPAKWHQCNGCERSLDRVEWLLLADRESGRTTEVYCRWCAERRGLWKQRDGRPSLPRVG